MPTTPCGSYAEPLGLCRPTLGPGVGEEQDAKQDRAPGGFLTLTPLHSPTFLPGTPALKCKTGVAKPPAWFLFQAGHSIASTVLDTSDLK